MNCPNCGSPIPDDSIMCHICGEPVKNVESVNKNVYTDYSDDKGYNQTISPTMQEQEIIYPDKNIDEPKENVILGIIGALIGALIGGGLIVLLGKLGYVSSILGFGVTFFIFVGYSIFAKNITKIGASICFILCAITPYIAHKIKWAIKIKGVMKVDNASLIEIYKVVPKVFNQNNSLIANYYIGLILVYVATLFCAYIMLKDILKR